ncbi:hypothetical protein L1D61_25860 [Vibrio mediterranei]|uniref:Uncharacterized protein n=1 Tax=Vibrio mediterranei TaxID=689 RepID=A0A3G4VQ62_9VIBR|nr:hypothetical protein [Vibrio mediterranei]AYV25021.1 hypothetical protein ECB94_27290 [Vibrio mediterranei]MCG9790561.1 hypothetical protein [Vibrio mediterranei]
MCANLAAKCIDIFDTGRGKLFSNSPSVLYVDSIGGSAGDAIYTENGAHGPAGDFYRFNNYSGAIRCVLPTTPRRTVDEVTGV